MNFPGHTATLIVKGTFDLAQDAAMTPAADQAPPTAPQRYPDSHGQNATLRYDFDFAPFKPRADVMVVGSCHAPHGQPVPACQIKVELSGKASVAYTLAVVGDRTVDLTDKELTPTPPKPFTSMPLRYERSLGGPEHAQNPIGCGLLPIAAARQEKWAVEKVQAFRKNVCQKSIETGESGATGCSPASANTPSRPHWRTSRQWHTASHTLSKPAEQGAALPKTQHRTVALPNILPADRHWPTMDAPPVGFGPIDPTWPLRNDKMGTCDDDWLKNRCPWYPNDFDFSHFNAAPPQLQPEGYIQGDETLTLTNLHPQHPKLRTRLPGVRVRCFVVPKTQPNNADGDAAPQTAPTLREVPMVIDTLWIDTDAQQAVLLWRGHTPVSSEECSDIERVFALSEPLDAPPQSIDQCHQQYEQALTQAHTKPQPQPDPPPQEEPQPETFGPELDASLREAIEAKLIQEGHDEATRAKILEMLNGDPEEIMKKLQTEVRENYRKAGMEPTLLVNLTPEQQKEKDRLLKQWGLDPVEIAQAEQMYRDGKIQLP